MSHEGMVVDVTVNTNRPTILLFGKDHQQTTIFSLRMLEICTRGK